MLDATSQAAYGNQCILFNKKPQAAFTYEPS